MKKNKLAEMIRHIVAEEVRKQLPAVVSEMYLRKLVSEVHVPEQSWEDSFDAELQKRHEKIPEMMDNNDNGIYQTSPIRRKNEAVVSKLLSGDNSSMSYLYEGMNPITSQRPGAPPQETAVGTDASLNALGISPGMYKDIEFNKPSSQAPMKQSDEAEERRIQLLRDSLDRPA